MSCRKIVQVAIGGEVGEKLVALCSDGSVWACYSSAFGQWARVDTSFVTDSAPAASDAPRVPS